MQNYSPRVAGHGNSRSNGLDGATQSFGGSPAEPQYSHYTYTRNAHTRTPETHSGISPIATTQKSPYFARMVPDWDVRKVIPTPSEGFRERLKSIPPPGKTLLMKQVNEIQKHFKATFSGDYKERWAEHLDRLETEVFELESFYPKQCYYALKCTLIGNASKSLQSIELGLEKVDYSTGVPPWYEPTRDDYRSLYNRMPFTSFSYPLRLAVIIVHFHRKFQKGTAKDAYIRFEEATQMQNETIEQWGLRLER